MCLVFVLLCSLRSSVWCGLWLDMCDIWSVVYASQTYYISFHMPPIAQYSFNRVEMHQTQADSSTVVSFVVNFMILVYELMCLMSGLYIMPARDYTCCFLYLLLRLTTSLLTCYDITGCDRSMYYLSCWVVAGFAASRLFTYTNNLVRYVCTYKLSSNDLCEVVLFSPHVFLFPKCLVYMVSLSYKRDQSLQHERKCNGMSIDGIVNVVICTS